MTDSIDIRAAVCRAPGAPMTLETLRLAAPAAGEVRVRVEACGICHSDIVAWRGDWAGMPMPAVYGHEVVGVVEALGPGASAPAVGTRVAVSLVRSCGDCQACERGHPVACRGGHALDTETRLQTLDGEPVHLGLLVGGFAEACVVDQSQVAAIPDDLDAGQAALLGCAVITGYCSVTRVAKMERDRTAVVIGTGGVGLNALQGAVINGASRVVAVDVSEEKLALARSLGAHETVCIAPGEDAVDAVLAALDGEGADYVFAAVGVSAMFSQGLRMLGPSGTLVLLGMPPDHDRALTLDCHALTTGRSLLGTKMGDTVPAHDVPALASLAREGRLRLDALVSGDGPLEQINELLAAASAGDTCRMIVRMGGV